MYLQPFASQQLLSTQTQAGGFTQSVKISGRCQAGWSDQLSNKLMRA